MRKIGIIGSGAIGGQLAFVLLAGAYDEVILVDIAEGLAEGKALDLMQAAAALGYGGTVRGGTDFSALAGCEVIAVTAGVARRPGMSREDLLAVNSRITDEVASAISRFVPESVVIVVTNPLDLMAYRFYVKTGFPRNRVIGMAGLLDTSRYRYFLAGKASVNTRDVEAMILGPHSDAMVITGRAAVGGRPLEDSISAEDISSAADMARNGGKQIVELLKNSSAFFAPASCISRMINAVTEDTGEIIPCSVHPGGEYGLGELFIGLPVSLGKGGVKEIVKLDISGGEREALLREARNIEDKIGMMKL